MTGRRRPGSGRARDESLRKGSWEFASGFTIAGERAEAGWAEGAGLAVGR